MLGVMIHYKNEPAYCQLYKKISEAETTKLYTLKCFTTGTDRTKGLTTYHHVVMC